MYPERSQAEFDLFVSYARADNRDEHDGKVSVLVHAIATEHERFAGAPPKVFFDTSEIRTVDDWEHRIVRGLRHSNMMVAVLSPEYFASDHCRKEWEIYVETELAQASPGEGITPVYVVTHPDLDRQSGSVDERLTQWVKDLKCRQYVEWRPFWPDGAVALEREDVRKKLDELPRQIAERLNRAQVRESSPNTVPLPSGHFVGRRNEMHSLLKDLIQRGLSAITAVQGIPGAGKSELARAYAWGYGYKYPGGRFLIEAGGQRDLAAGMIALAEPKAVVLTDAERTSPELALAKVKAAFEAGPPALIVIDNLDQPQLLAEPARDRVLPRGDHIHTLFTTRIAPEYLPGIRCSPLDSLDAEDALALLQSFRPTADSPHDEEWKAALEIVSRRLGGHALAVEVAGVFLSENPDVSCRDFLEHLERDGITVLYDEAGPDAGTKLEDAKTCIAWLLRPTLRLLKAAELRAVEYAAFLPPDNVPLPWLRDLLESDFPELNRAGLIDPISKILERLERLRLVVPLERDRGHGMAWTPGSDRLARMHRLVQEVVRARLDRYQQSARERAVNRFAARRGEWLKGRLVQPGLTWELSPLWDLALRWIEQGEREGCLLADAIATPLLQIGRTLDVRDLWRTSAAMFERLAGAAPNNVDYARELSVNYNKLGDLARASGNPTAARRYYEDGRQIAKRLADLAPDDADYARDVWVSDNRLGDMARAGGDPATARRCYEDGLEIANRLTDLVPDNADCARDLSISYERLGDLAMSRGSTDLARRYYEDGLAIRKRLRDAAPDSALYASYLAVSYERLGDLAMSSGDAAAARWHYEDLLEIAKWLAETAPDNADYARDLAISENKLGDLAISGGDLAAARRYYQHALTIAKRLSDAALDNADYARDLSVSYNKLGDLAMSSGDPATARQYYEDLLKIAKRLADLAPENADYARDLSVSYDRLGDLARSSGDKATARRYYEAGLEIATRLADLAPDNADFARDLWVSCWRMARLTEQSSGRDAALNWWRRAYDVLAGMKGRGLFISAEDQGFLRRLEEKLGLP
jgi:tetratricopeptide (TPR) repeat protein